jgi:hypothetical protein
MIAGRFRLEHRIGAGGMGVVYRARDERSGAPVAIKLLEVAGEADLIRAQREAAALRALAHPGIVAHVDHGVADGRLFIAMEWVDGITLADRLAAPGVDLREAIEVVRGVAEALGAAHAAGFVHRDVKPSNILVLDDDVTRCKLIDFGVVRLAGARGLTRTGTAIGTPAYMAPEQARGTRELTPAADVFALGCVLYECATGRPTFSGAHAAAVLAKIVFAEPLPLERGCPEAPPVLRRLLERMLAKDADRRPRDGAEVARELADLGSRVPAGPRRTTRAVLADETARAPAEVAHGLVLASRGHPDEDQPPPDPSRRAELAEIARHHQVALEILDTGGVAGRLAGLPGDVAARAARCALAFRDALPGWTVVVTALAADVGDVAERGVAALATESVAAIFGDPAALAGILIDPAIARLLDAEFDVAPGPPPRLRGRSRA